jgi:hypothetical protein
MIKVHNPITDGYLFHYAHFICDCLFPEIICDIFNYDEVIRLKNINQTLGNFNKIYEEVTRVKNTELLRNEFDNLNVDMIHYKKRHTYANIINFNKFRNYIFERYNIKYDNNYPEVILIKRNDRTQLVDDAYLQTQNLSNFIIKSGKERREIKDVTEIESYLQDKFKDKFKGLYFEHLPFEEQIKYFNNAKFIICAHGAVMSNMFFCKSGTTILEVKCGMHWPFFDTISRILNLNHLKCHKNNKDTIIKWIDNIVV